MKLPKIIGLTGRKYAGKTEAANFLEAEYGYRGTPITDPMIEMAIPLLRRMTNENEEVIQQRLQPWGKMKDDAIPGYEHLTGRKILQAIGKDVRDALSKPSDNAPEGNNHGTDSTFFYSLWMKDNKDHALICNQSVRYPFERDIIVSNGGEVWRIINPESQVPHDDHPSERQDWPVTREIIAPHSMGIGYLHQKIREILSN